MSFMSKLRNSLILGIALSVSFAAFAAKARHSVQNNESINEPTVVTASAENQSQINEKVNINTATANDLLKVKYFGKKKAQAVIDYRAKNGNFKSVDELLNVKCRGITQRWLNRISANLTV